MKCTNCGRTKNLKEFWKNIWLCGCCREDLGATALYLEEKGFDLTAVMGKSIIRVQKDQHIVDGKMTWDRWRLHDNHKWCCTPLEESPEIEFNGDGKFGFSIDEYQCGEWIESNTEEISYCPYCGRPIEVVVEEPRIKRGKKITEKEKSGWEQDWIIWEDGSREKSGSRHARFRIVK